MTIDPHDGWTPQVQEQEQPPVFSPESEALRAALRKLPPAPYRVEWPTEQGGAFTLWGQQGTPPDFADGWAIPLVASGVDIVIYALVDILNTLVVAVPSPAPAVEALDVRRVVKAIESVAARHGIKKDPPVSVTLARIYGYSTTLDDMDAQIAAEYAALRAGTPEPPDAARQRGYACGYNAPENVRARAEVERHDPSNARG